MALTKCSECQKEMSDTLEACPHCGFKIIKTAEHLKATGTNIICTGCGKSYYKGASKCPYCKIQNTNKINPFAKQTNGATTDNNSQLKASFNFISSIIKNHPRKVLYSLLFIIFISVIFISADKIISSIPTQFTATQYEEYFQRSLVDMEDSLQRSNLHEASNRARSGLDGTNVPDYNYFKMNGISNENDIKYFSGNLNKKLADLKNVNEQIILASVAIDNLKEINLSLLPDERVKKAYTRAMQKAKQKAIEKANVAKQYEQNNMNAVKVKNIIESFIRKNSDGYAYQAKDALVSKLKFKVISSDFVKTNYGNSHQQKLSGTYLYMNSNFNVDVTLTDASSDSFTYSVNATY